MKPKFAPISLENSAHSLSLSSSEFIFHWKCKKEDLKMKQLLKEKAKGDSAAEEAD